MWQISIISQLVCGTLLWQFKQAVTWYYYCKMCCWPLISWQLYVPSDPKKPVNILHSSRKRIFGPWKGPNQHSEMYVSLNHMKKHLDYYYLPLGEYGSCISMVRHVNYLHLLSFIISESYAFLYILKLNVLATILISLNKSQLSFEVQAVQSWRCDCRGSSMCRVACPAIEWLQAAMLFHFSYFF